MKALTLWQPWATLIADGRTVSCAVLDPFAGSATTGRVATELNRRAILVDLAYNPDSEKHYAALAQERLSEVQRELPLL
jgi:DNA modification methylase